MRNFFSIVMTCLLLSCSINKKFKTIEYPIDSEKQKLILRIPKGFFASHTLWEGLDDGFKYNDSSIVYITDMSNGGVNYDNIELAGLKPKLFNAFLEKDTITLNGVDKFGLYWKNRLLVGYNIGYKNVKPARKAEFDKVIDSLRIE